MPTQRSAAYRPIGFLIPHIVLALRSALRAPAGEQGSLSALEARMIGELGQFGELTMTSLAEIVGNDKSQVSHALKRLLTAGIVQREAVRSGLRLTANGHRIVNRLQAGARRDCKVLLQGFSRTEQTQFMAGVSHLTQVATQLLEEEKQLEAGTQGRRRRRISKIGPATMSGAMLPEALPARLITLSTLLLRSSLLAFKRLTGLSNARSTVLVYVWEYAPVSAQRLSELTARTRKRIERDAAALEELELIRRGKSLSSHDWMYDRTEDGSKTYGKLAAEVARREQRLAQDFNSQELRRFRSLLERVAESARMIRD
jgi:DNA-binding MarR family transcriptional regulator